MQEAYPAAAAAAAAAAQDDLLYMCRRQRFWQTCTM